jgi:hypothetical protein
MEQDKTKKDTSLEKPDKKIRTPEKNREENTKVAITPDTILATKESFVSDIYSPKTLKEYAEIDKRILDLAIQKYELTIREYESEGNHRRKNEDKLITHSINMNKLGLFSSLGVTTLFWASGSWLIYLGHDYAGLGLCGAGLVSIVTAFLRYTQKKG